MNKGFQTGSETRFSRAHLYSRPLTALYATMATLLMVSFAAAATPQLLSSRDGAAALPAGGNGDSVGARISADGRFVVFTSSASDLVAGDNRKFNTDVFLRDRASNTTTLVSVNLAGTGGGNSHSMFPQISSNGRYVLFESDAADLVAGDTNTSTDIFLRDTQSGTTMLVSANTNGVPGVGRSYDAVMTPDGRYVTFVSMASTLVSNDSNNIPDVFVRDMTANTNILVSVGAVPGGGVTATPQITPDGRYVAFFSSATGMVAGVNPSIGQVYVRDLQNGTTTWASTNGPDILLATLGPNALNSLFRHPSMSVDGRYIAFMGGTNRIGKTLILLFDQVSGTTSMVATNGVAAFPADDNPYGPEITPEARFIAYVKLEDDGTNSNIYVWDSVTGTNILVSSDGSGLPVNGNSHSPVITTSGQFVTFLSNGTDLVTNAASPGFHVYLRNLQAGTTQLVDADTNNAGSADVEGTYPGLSESGSFVVFDAPDSKLVGRDNNNARDVFLRDTVGGTNALISQRSAVMPQTGYRMTRLSPNSIAADGRWIAFGSFANDLVPDDTNDWGDVFVRDLWAGQTLLVSTPTSMVSNVSPHAFSPAISGNGRYVAYVRALYNGKTNLNMTSHNVFRFDRATGSNALVSVGTDGTSSANGDCLDPAISFDGRYVAFVSAATNLTTNTPTGAGTYWRDMDTGATVLLSPGAPTSSRFSPSMSADGRFVAYQTNNLVRVRDLQLGTDVYTNANAVSSAAISFEGSRLLYHSAPNVRVDRISPRTNLMSFSTLTIVQSSGQWSSDGRYVAFVGRTNLSSDKSRVYLCDLVTSNVTLVGFNATNFGTPNGPSDMPAVSGNGQFIVYRSYATDIVAGDTNPAPKIFLYDRFTGQNSILSAAQNEPEPCSWVSAPVISAGAENVAFLSIGSDLAAPDLNRAADAFSVRVLMRVQISSTPSPGGTATLAWQTVPERNYTVQYKDDLNDPQWQDISLSISFTANMASATVSTAEPRRFYRIIESEP